VGRCVVKNKLKITSFDNLFTGAPITPMKIWIPYNNDEKCKKKSNLRWFKSLQEGECDWFGDCIY
jgi:hypothetical protein